MNAMGMVDYLMNSYIDTPVRQWGKILSQADIPRYSKTFPAIVLTLINLITSNQPGIVDVAIDQLLKRGIKAVRQLFHFLLSKCLQSIHNTFLKSRLYPYIFIQQGCEND